MAFLRGRPIGRGNTCQIAGGPYSHSIVAGGLELMS